jgi:two-component system, cell cycle response regulator DivK
MLPDNIARRALLPSQAAILVVEDKVDSYVTIVRLLAYCGVIPQNSFWKPSGWGVVQYADSLPRIDLILLDIGLPYEDGYQVFEAIKKHDRFVDARIVAVTGHTGETETRKARSAGFNGFLSKPLDIERFPGQLSRILRGEAVWE